MQSWLPVENRSSYPKHHFDRRFEPRSQDGVDSLKHGRLAHIRSQFSLFRRSPTHKNLPLAIFCTSEQGVPRFCKPRISAPQRRFRAGRFAAFAGVSRRRPLPVHTKRVCRLLCKHSQAAKPPFGRSLPGTFHLLLKKQDKRGVGAARRACFCSLSP